MDTAQNPAVEKLYKKFAALRATLPTDERDIFDQVIPAEKEVTAHKIQKRVQRRKTRDATEVAAHKIQKRVARKVARNAPEVAAHKIQKKVARKVQKKVARKTSR
jgi:hypothetical protein